MSVIGLTGGIASGKRLAAERLSELGAHSINGDLLGHQSYAPGTRGFDNVVAEFGDEVVGEDGEIDRAVLGPKVFSSPDGLEKLNSIVWPEIRLLAEAEIQSIRENNPTAQIVLEAAVLIEAEWQDLCDEVWVVSVPESIAIERLMARNNLDRDAAQSRIDSQMSVDERENYGDVVIHNDSSIEEFSDRIDAAWRELSDRS